MRTRKLVTEAMVKPVGYDVHSVHSAVIINKPNTEYLIIGDWCMYDQLVFLVFVYILISFDQ